MKNLILGTGVSFSKSPDIAAKVVASSIDCFVRRFDTAPSYMTESLLGNILIRECKKRNLHREEIYIQTKIDAWQMREGKIQLYTEEALKKLHTDYLDALLIHWPIPEYMAETWKRLEELKAKGIVKKIGICNLRIRQLQKYVNWSPDIVQIERHPLNIFREETNFCRANNLEIQAYSPLCKMNNRIKNNEALSRIADKYGKNLGQVILRWHLDTSVIPIFTTTKTSRVKSYTKLDDFSLTEEEIETIDGLNENYKMYLELVACPGF